MAIGPTIGDLAQTYLLRARNTQLQRQNQTLLLELSSGQAADPVKHLDGYMGQLVNMDRDLTMLEGHRHSASEAQFTVTAMQSALEQIQNIGEELANSTLINTTLTNDLDLSLLSDQASQSLEDIVLAMNVRPAGRSVFSGTQVDSPALTSAQNIRALAFADLGGAVTTNDVFDALDVFFDTPGGTFETSVYLGSDEGLAPLQLGEGEFVQLDVRADNPVAREVLKYTVALSVALDPDFGLNDDQRQDLAKQATARMMDAQGAMTELRASLGYAEHRIDKAVTRLASEFATLELARSDLLSVDPFKTATDLETTQSQIEMLYTLTARSARLNLVSFLS
jgi:flagellar hook-associated protein 3 FlgL